jgi:hypothetical protein
LLLSLAVPRINVHMTGVIIDAIHAEVGAALPIGAKLLDLTVDLSAAAPHDCPPVAHYRMIIRDRAWLRRLDVASGDEPQVGASLAVFSTEQNEPLDRPPQRQVRVAIAGILSYDTFGWS